MNKLYLGLQKLNLHIKFRSLRKYVSRGTWADYGAGTGAFVRYLNHKKIRAIGFEPSEIARANALTEGTKLQTTLNYHDKEQFACITMWHVLEHIPNPEKILESHRSSLLADGILAIAVPMIDSYDSMHYKEFWAALDVPRHLWHFTPAHLITLVEGAGFKYIQTHSLPLDATYVSLLSEQYKKGSMLSGIYRGLFSNIIAKLTRRSYSSQTLIFQKLP